MTDAVRGRHGRMRSRTSPTGNASHCVKWRKRPESPSKPRRTSSTIPAAWPTPHAKKCRTSSIRLGYRVNVSARNLNRGKTGFITLAVPSLTAPYLAELANRVIDAARIYGYSVYVTTYAEGMPRRVPRALLRNFNATVSDGMILSHVRSRGPRSPRTWTVDYPLVCVGARSTHRQGGPRHPGRRAGARVSPRNTCFDHGATQAGGDRLAHRSRAAYPRLCATPRKATRSLRMRGVFEACCRPQGVALGRTELMPNVGQDWTDRLGRAQ